MHLNLTLPGFGGSKKKKSKGGRVINKSPKDPQKDAEDVWSKSVSPNTANRALYDQHTKGQSSRTQQAYGEYKGQDIPDASTDLRKTTGQGSTWNKSKDHGGGAWSSWGKVTLALKKLTGN